MAACVLPQGCGSISYTLENYRLAVESWRGANISELWSAWPKAWYKGKSSPAEDTTAHDFHWREEYYQEAEQYYDHAHQEWQEKTPAGKVLLICDTRFITDPDGVITSVRPGTYQCGQMPAPPARAR